MSPLGPFRLTERLVDGTEAWIWRVEHVHSGMPAILRAYQPRPDRKPIDWYFRLVSTWRPLALLDHPNLLGIFDYGLVSEDDSRALGGQLKSGCSWFVEEDAPGGNLAQHPPDNWIECRQALESVLRGLMHLHGHNLLHGSIRPDQIRRGAEAHPHLKLGGFAIGPEHRLRVLDGVLPGLVSDFAAPELQAGDWREVRASTDLYGVGALAHWMVYGEAPTTDKERLQTTMTLPRSFNFWLKSLLDPDPAARPWSASQVLLGLEQMNQKPRVLMASMPTPRIRDEVPAPKEMERDKAWQAMGLRLHGAREFPIFGRQDEQKKLWSTLQQAIQKEHPYYLRLTGPRSVGKSVLSHWLIQQAQKAGLAQAIVLKHGDDGGPHTGISGALHRYLRCHGLGPEEILKRCQFLLRSLGAEDPYEWQALCQLLAPDHGITRVVFETTQQRFKVIENLLRRLASRRPLLIVLENAHLGAESLAMVRHLMGLHRMDSFPLCIVSNEDSARLSERPAEAKLLGDLVTSGQVNSLPVLPLHPNQLSQLLIEGLHLSPQTMEALKWRCEDDLYFALELIRDSADQRLLVFEDAQVSLPPDQELKLPKHLHDLWQGRIDRAMKLLDEDADGASRQCFELAALLGRDVHQDEWHDACRRAGHELKQDLINVLLATGLGVGTEDGFRFQHALIVESIIQSSEEKGRRQHLAEHSLSVLREAAERSGGDVRLVRHLERTGRADEALLPLTNAANQSMTAGHLNQAEIMLSRRAQMLQGSGGDASQDPEQLASEIRLALLRRNIKQAWTQIDHLESVVTGGQLRAQWAELSAQILEHRGDRELVQERLQEAITSFESEAQKMNAQRCRLSLARHYRISGDLRQASLELDQISQNMDQLGTMPVEMAHDYHFERGAMAEASKQLAEATQAFAISLRHAEELGHQGRIGQTVMSLADVARRAENPKRAEAWYRRALEAFQRLGSEQVAQAQIQLGFLFFAQGRLIELRDLLGSLEVNLVRYGDNNLIGQLEALKLGLAARDLNWEEFDRCLQALYSLRLDRGLVSVETAELLEEVGRAARRDGELERAEHALQGALRQWEPINRLTEVKRVKAELNAIAELKPTAEGDV